jgi:4-amino-4-deoxy-L-arabinose transferase-like glycosyltransferase
MIDLLADLALAAMMMLSIYGVGRTIFSVVPLRFWGRAAEMAYIFAFGLGAVATVLFGLALLGWLRPAAGWALLIAGAGLGAAHYRALWEGIRAAWCALRDVLRGSWYIRALLAVAAAFALMNLVADLAPPVEGDTVHQYLLLPRYWVAEGRYVQPAHIWAATLPGNMMMLSAWALLLNGSYSLATLVTGFGLSIVLALGVYALARLYFSRGAAVMAAVAIYTMPDAGYLAQSAKVDMGWALFEALALAAFFRWLDLTPRSLFDPRPPRASHSTSWLVLSGICLGLAAGSKNQTFISIALLGLWLVLRHILRGEWRALPRAALAFGLAALAALLPFYLYNGIVHHNPFYPVFAEPFARFFGGTLSPRSELGTEVFYPWTVGGYLANLWNASLGHTQPGFYLGFIAGPIFLLTIPAGAALGALRGQPITGRMLGYAFAFSVIWFLVKQAARHFLPGLILLAVVAGLVLWWLEDHRSWPAQVVLAVSVLVLGWNFVNGLGVLYWNGAYRVAFGLETRQEYLRRWHDDVILPTFPDWETISVLNSEIEPTARVLSIHATSPLYIELDFIPGSWGSRDRLDTVTDEAVLLDKLAQQHIGYILTYTVDASRAVLFAQPGFLAEHAELVYAGPRTALYRLR